MSEYSKAVARLRELRDPSAKAAFVRGFVVAIATKNRAVCTCAAIIDAVLLKEIGPSAWELNGCGYSLRDEVFHWFQRAFRPESPPIRIVGEDEYRRLAKTAHGALVRPLADVLVELGVVKREPRKAPPPPRTPTPPPEPTPPEAESGQDEVPELPQPVDWAARAPGKDEGIRARRGKILDLLGHEHGTRTIREIADALGEKFKAIENDLAVLMKAGLIICEGGRPTRYRLAA